jgi:hypothetical protein
MSSKLPCPSMADTRAYSDAERWVREIGLPAHFPGQRFEKRELRVGTRRDGSAGYHSFDAVSQDGRIVTSVKASSGLTKGGKLPVGKTKDSFTELHFLSLVEAPYRFLVLTDPDFHQIFVGVSDGKLPPGVEILHIPLPGDLQAKVGAARAVASSEVTPISPTDSR